MMKIMSLKGTAYLLNLEGFARELASFLQRGLGPFWWLKICLREW